MQIEDRHFWISADKKTRAVSGLKYSMAIICGKEYSGWKMIRGGKMYILYIYDLIDNVSLPVRLQN